MHIRVYIYLITVLSFATHVQAQVEVAPSIYVLGVAQDGGYPHMGCSKKCCADAWNKTSARRYVVALALADPVTKKWWLFEATPDIKEQLHYFRELTRGEYPYMPAGIFITHAHIGHYTGLTQIGREVMNIKDMPVYVLPKMKYFLENNGPWSQLLKLNNILINTLDTGSAVFLSENIIIETFTVPHRDEYSETAGFKVKTVNKKYLFIPDINKWGKWHKNIIDEISAVDFAFVDATFFDTTELSSKRMSEVSHPLVLETMQIFEKTSELTKSKIHFIHFNHTNPLLRDKNKKKELKTAGFNIAEQGAQF